MTVELTDEQAILLRLLALAGAHQVKSGSITVHFDSQGVPVQVETRTVQKLSTGG